MNSHDLQQRQRLSQMWIATVVLILLLSVYAVGSRFGYERDVPKDWLTANEAMETLLHEQASAQMDSQRTNLKSPEEKQQVTAIPKDQPKFNGQQHAAIININKADMEKLTELPGIGPSKAQAIVNYREQVGSFQEVEQLLDVKGIGDKTLEAIRSQIIVADSP